MAKFPSQNKLLYETGPLGDDVWTAAGYLNLPKDLSILNRRGYMSTTAKGVPLVYRVAITMSQHTVSGRQSARNADAPTTASAEDTVETAPAADNSTLLRVNGCQNNWVFRNAAVKWHAARNNMWKKAGIRRRDLGTWAKGIRYNFDSASQSWLSPLDGDGDAFTGGTWDVSTMVDMIDNEYQLGLTCAGVDEDSAHSTSIINIAHAYLSSRAQPPADSNLESSETPAQFSHLSQLLRPTNLESNTEESYIRTDVMQEQDNPPYELFATETTSHDITEPVELGRVICGVGNAVGTTVMDIPFGLAQFEARHAGSQNQTILDPVAVQLQVLDIFEMQG